MGDYSFHEPVMVQEVIDYLITEPGGTYIDGTAGGGGHSDAILHRLNVDGTLIAIDVDADAIRHIKQRFRSFKNQILYAHCSYSEMDKVLLERGIPSVNGVLLDLGVSSYQIDAQERGFSYMSDGPLDMRMSDEQAQTVADIVNTYEAKELQDIIRRFGEDRRAGSIARQIVKQRIREPLQKTSDLVAAVERAVPFKMRVKSVSRTFQAFRIYLNNELERLQIVLPLIVDRLVSSGRMVILTYHSLEDRIVKQFIQSQTHPCTCPPELPVCVCHKQPTVKNLTKRALMPTDAEIRRNVRARSAKLRAIEKL